MNMKKPVKVLHYVPGFKFGGIESRLLDWYRHIDRDKIQFDVLILTDEENDLLDKIKELGGNVYKLPPLSLKSASAFLKEIKNFFSEHNDYDIVHSHNLTSGYFFLKEAKKSGVPKRVIHSRTTSFDPDTKNVLIKELLKKLTPFYATDYFACSYEAGIWAFNDKHLNSEKFHIINNGVESNKFVFNKQIRQEIRKGLDIETNFIVGCIARFTTQKNMTFLLEVFLEIKNKLSNAKLLLIGDGEEREKIVDTAERLGIIDSVIILGKKDNVEDYLQAMDVFVGTSLFEGFGTVAIEAQAAGLPTVISDGFPESVDITNLVMHIPLEEESYIWAQKIVSFTKQLERRNTQQEIIDEGFDVKSTAQFLEKFYLNK